MAGSVTLRFTTGGVQAASANQWAPALSGHDPNPPLSIEDTPFSQDDWPNPRRADFSVALRGHLQGITTRDDTTSVLRAPLITSLWPLSIAVALVACTPPNLLLSTLATQPAPFSQRDWPVPQARSAAIELRTFIGPNVALLAPQSQAATPFVPPVPENPVLGALRIGTQLGRPGVDPTPQTQPPGQALQPDRLAQPARPGELTATRSPALGAVVQAPFALADWPNPVRQRRVEVEYTWLQSPTVPPAAGAPFTPGDWPNPQLRRAGGDASATLGGVLVDLTPLRPVDWPLPQRSRLDVTSLTWTDTLKLPLQVAPSAPVQAFDWPLPVRKPLDVARLTWTKALELSAQPAPTLPPSSGYWPNPLRPQRLPDYTVALGLQQSTLTPAPPPFACNTPLPRGYAFPLANRGHVQAAAVWLIGQDKFYGAAGLAPTFDYPNPRTRLDARAIAAWSSQPWAARAADLGQLVTIVRITLSDGTVYRVSVSDAAAPSSSGDQSVTGITASDE